METFLNFGKETQQIRLLCESWTKDTTAHMDVTAVGGNNADLNAGAATFARCTVVEFIGRPYLNVFNQKRLIPLNIDLHMKLMPSPNNFVCKTAEPGQGAQQENYKIIFQIVNLIIHTTKLTSTAHDVLMDLLVDQNMRHHFLRVQL